MNLKKIKNGRYQVRWRDRDGVQRAKNFRSREVGQDFMRKLMAGLVESEKAATMTFAAFADEWHRNYCRVEKAEIQWTDDLSTIRNHLLPTLGKKTLGSLSKVDLLSLRGRLKSEGRLSVKTVNNITALAKTMMSTAVDWEFVRVNPFAKVKLLKRDELRFAYWSAEERDRFLVFARRLDPAFADVVCFTCHTGLRIGEVAGLRRDCLDFDRRVVVVRRSYSAKLRKSFERTKSGKIREVPLNDAAWRVAVDRRLLAPTDVVFPDLDPGHASRRLRQIAAVAQVTPLRFHDLRHTFASHLAMAGVPVQKIQAVLGHADIKQTMHYARLAPGALTGLTDVLVSGRSVHNPLIDVATLGN